MFAKILVPSTLALLLSLSSGLAANCSAGEPAWTNHVLKRGVDRQVTNATDILERPYRPLHFYGNTVRRAHYRGTPRPSLGDVVKTVKYIAER
ncbi:hypothetical protein [Aureliella helgolandensis]|uniref:Uncharacterized protein n=1 Tax=Aureliella helgolandensis TaxID=2527968 RepID=A0A518G7B7_9BACT|nr:hypothetical protein [Aureliella helgolandensis]QDV24471.1 hypothetical protein Q31a_27890 [Aureliella helgolandensis]